MTTRSKISNAVKMALLATTAATIALSNPLIAAEQNDDNEEDTKKITVLGSRIKRTQAEGAQPVIVINQDEATEKGYITVFDALKNLSQNTGTVQGSEFSGGFTPDLQTINLRGFGVGKTLFLINGRRVANYPAVYNSDTSAANLANIPFAAVEEIQVLTTGASAIYGSDAVSGVVNVILKKDMDETVFNLLVGAPLEATDKKDIRFQASTGFNWDNANIVLGYQYTDRDRLRGGDFDDYDSDLDYPYGAGVLTRNVLDLNWWTNFFGDSTQRYQDPGAGTCEALANGSVRSFRPGAGYFCGTDAAAETTFRNPTEKHSFFAYGSMQLNDTTELFSDVLYTTSDSSVYRRGIFVSEDVFDTTNIVDTGPFGLQPNWFLAQRMFTGEELNRDLSTQFDNQEYSISFGARGVWGENDWELSFNHSKNELEVERPWLKAQEVVDTFLGTYQGIGFTGDNWWSGTGTFGLRDNLLTPITDANRDIINNVIGIQRYGNEGQSNSLQFIMSGDLFEMNAGAASYALTAEYEEQEIEYIPDELIQQDPIAPYLSGSGWWNLTGYSGGGDRQRAALGGELLLPLSESFELELAGRFDRYDSQSSSIGTRFTPSLKFTWRPLETDLLIRGGYSESYRAPDLAQVHIRTGFFTTATDLTQCLQTYIFNQGQPGGGGDLTGANFDQDTCTSGSQFVQRVGPAAVGSEPLKDETGFSAWFGFSAEVGESQTLMATMTRTSLEDLVQTESIQDILDDELTCFFASLDASRPQPNQAICDAVDARIDRTDGGTTGITGITRFNASPVNADKLVIDALDVVYNWDIPSDFGDWGLRLDYSLMTKREFTAKGGTPQDLRDDPVAGGWVPRSTLVGSLSWRHDDWAARLTGRRVGSTTIRRVLSSRLASGDVRVEPYITYNLSVGYNWSENLQTRLIVNNLFDKEPPRDSTHAFFQAPWYNIFAYPGAGIGRTVNLEATYRIPNE